MPHVTPRDRMLAAMNHRTPDRAPLDIGGIKTTSLNVRAYENLRAYHHERQRAFPDGAGRGSAGQGSERLMPTATPAEVEAAVVECLRVGAPGGGYVLATDHSFHEGIPIENVKAFIEAGLKHGAY